MRSCFMIVGDADCSFTANEMPYLSQTFQEVHIFAYNSLPDAKLQVDFPKNVVIHHLGVIKGFARLIRYVSKGLFCREPDLAVKTLHPNRILTSLYSRGRAEAVYQQILSIIAKEQILVQNGVVYSYWFTDQAIVAWRLAEELRRRGGKFKSVSRAHGYDLYWERNCARYLPFQDISLKHLDGVFPCSAVGRDYLCRKYPKYVNNLHIARLGTYEHGLGPVPQKGECSFVTCSRLDGNKRVSLFAAAFCELRRKRFNCHWYCIGDGVERSKVEAIIASAEARSAVTMLGQLSNEEVVSFYKENPIDYFVNVSLSEGVPVSIMEAMSFGIQNIIKILVIGKIVFSI